MKKPTASFLWLAAALVLSGSIAQSAPAVPKIGEPLPAWSEGQLDIHHISTGRGDSNFLILPDGTTLLVDASDGQAKPLGSPFNLLTKPDSSRQAGEWIARYILRALRNFPEKKIDYAVLSHFHGDHIGTIREETKYSPARGYMLTGISEIAEFVPVARIIDRNWPDYNYPKPLRDANVENYRKFLQWQITHRGLVVEQFQPGRNDQLRLLHDAKAYPDFELRNLAANGVVWTGTGSETRSLFPPPKTVTGDYPDENKLSIAFRVRYGKFDYYTGGDLDSNDEETTAAPPAWMNIEPVVAQVCGPVDAMKADHHGSWNANSIPFLAALRPRVIVVTSRAEGHPAQNTFAHMTSKKVWPGARDIFITNLSPATAQTTYNVEKTAKSTQGHVVIRVDTGGATYHVYVLDDSNEEQRVKAVFGPYTSN